MFTKYFWEPSALKLLTASQENLLDFRKLLPQHFFHSNVVFSKVFYSTAQWGQVFGGSWLNLHSN